MKVKYPQLHDRAWLERAYLDDERTRDDIAAELDCSPSAVYYALLKLGIPRRQEGRPPKDPSNDAPH